MCSTDCLNLLVFIAVAWLVAPNPLPKLGPRDCSEKLWLYYKKGTTVRTIVINWNLEGVNKQVQNTIIGTHDKELC